MARDTLQYDKMVESALRGVVRQALIYVSKNGLPGNHHFYLTFRTDYPGVDISDSLRGQYPNDMTVVLQHQYWGLEVNDDHFVVNLSFSNMPERLQVPYAAMMSFVDPSVKFGLQFQPLDGDASASLSGGFAAAAAATESSKPAKAKLTEAKLTEAKPAEGKPGEAKPIELKPALKPEPVKGEIAKTQTAKPAPAKAEDAARKDEPAKPAADAPAEGAAAPAEKVVSLDAFRKK
jgi:uncharacterized protein